jgi:hypothetical protein
MTTHTIIENGIDSTITEEQAENLVTEKAIYHCPECDPLPGENVYHVSPDTELERQYQDATGPFAFLA